MRNVDHAFDRGVVQQQHSQLRERGLEIAEPGAEPRVALGRNPTGGRRDAVEREGAAETDARAEVFAHPLHRLAHRRDLRGRGIEVGRAAAVAQPWRRRARSDTSSTGRNAATPSSTTKPCMLHATPSTNDATRTRSQRGSSNSNASARSASPRTQRTRAPPPLNPSRASPDQTVPRPDRTRHAARVIDDYVRGNDNPRRPRHSQRVEEVVRRSSCPRSRPIPAAGHRTRGDRRARARRGKAAPERSPRGRDRTGRARRALLRTAVRSRTPPRECCR